MKAKKLSLSELKVDSFITDMNDKGKETVQGGDITISLISVMSALSVLYSLNIYEEKQSEIHEACLPDPKVNESVMTCAHVGCPLTQRVNCPGFGTV